MSWIHDDETTNLARLRRAGFVERQITLLFQLRRGYAQDKMNELLLDRHRLEFARFLVKTGRLTEEIV